MMISGLFMNQWNGKFCKILWADSAKSNVSLSFLFGVSDFFLRTRTRWSGNAAHWNDGRRVPMSHKNAFLIGSWKAFMRTVFDIFSHCLLFGHAHFKEPEKFIMICNLLIGVKADRVLSIQQSILDKLQDFFSVKTELHWFYRRITGQR